MSTLELKYGCNPHQKNAKVIFDGEVSPLKVLNGAPSYINILDALAAWQLVKELKAATGIASAASFKHVSPAGAAIAKPLDSTFLKSQFVTESNFSPASIAYIRARGGDRMCAFGDAAAVSETVDVSLANILKSEVSDLIIAPGYEPEALEILKSKKKGGYLVLQIDAEYEPSDLELKTVYGFTLQQERNNAVINKDFFNNVITANKQVPNEALQSLILATIALKYTQSNSVVVAYDGQLIGVGAGQQSRVHCLRLACSKADKWFLQQHPKVLGLEFVDGLKKPEKANVVDQFLLWDELSDNEKMLMASQLKSVPEPISFEEKTAFIRQFNGVSLSSDAFFPFRDNIDRAFRSNVQFVAQAGGSLRDDICVDAADEYGMVMFHTGTRLFTH
ncbi:MAG: phosphoribosylaminoimidazolecarboxamide formyltransferase [Bacteroidota bacterium]|nr:phosphoribosylaminoimidazolecarboxamide formyltransferase [Bacteroidota bacterium]